MCGLFGILGNQTEHGWVGCDPSRGRENAETSTANDVGARLSRGGVGRSQKRSGHELRHAYLAVSHCVAVDVETRSVVGSIHVPVPHVSNLIPISTQETQSFGVGALFQKGLSAIHGTETGNGGCERQILI